MGPVFWFRVGVLRFGVQSLGLWVQCYGFKVPRAGYFVVSGIQGTRSRITVWVLRCRLLSF